MIFKTLKSNKNTLFFRAVKNSLRCLLLLTLLIFIPSHSDELDFLDLINSPQLTHQYVDFNRTFPVEYEVNKPLVFQNGTNNGSFTVPVGTVLERTQTLNDLYSPYSFPNSLKSLYDPLQNDPLRYDPFQSESQNLNRFLFNIFKYKNSVEQKYRLDFDDEDSTARTHESKDSHRSSETKSHEDDAENDNDISKDSELSTDRDPEKLVTLTVTESSDNSLVSKKIKIKEKQVNELEKKGAVKKRPVDIIPYDEKNEPDESEDDIDNLYISNGSESQKTAPGKSEGGTNESCLVCRGNSSPRSSDRFPKELLGATEHEIAKKINSDFKDYSSNKKTQTLINYAMKNKSRESEGFCFRKVKYALQDSKLVDKYLDGVRPRYAKKELEKQGFKNLLEEPYYKNLITKPDLAPKGALLVFEPDPSDRMVWLDEVHKNADPKYREHILVPDYGDISIKVNESGKGGYVSDHYNVNSVTYNKLITNHRKLIGVYIKPEID